MGDLDLFRLYCFSGLFGQGYPNPGVPGWVTSTFWTGGATRVGTGGGNFVVDHLTRDDPKCLPQVCVFRESDIWDERANLTLTSLPQVDHIVEATRLG